MEFRLETLAALTYWRRLPVERAAEYIQILVSRANLLCGDAAVPLRTIGQLSGAGLSPATIDGITCPGDP